MSDDDGIRFEDDAFDELDDEILPQGIESEIKLALQDIAWAVNESNVTLAPATVCMTKRSCQNSVSCLVVQGGV